VAGFAGTVSLFTAGCSGIGSQASEDGARVVKRIHLINTTDSGQKVDVVLISGSNTLFWGEHEVKSKQGDTAGDAVVDGPWTLENNPKRILIKAASGEQESGRNKTVDQASISSDQGSCIELKATVRENDIPVSTDPAGDC